MYREKEFQIIQAGALIKDSIYDVASALSIALNSLGSVGHPKFKRPWTGKKTRTVDHWECELGKQHFWKVAPSVRKLTSHLNLLLVDCLKNTTLWNIMLKLNGSTKFNYDLKMFSDPSILPSGIASWLFLFSFYFLLSLFLISWYFNNQMSSEKVKHLMLYLKHRFCLFFKWSIYYNHCQL